MTRWRAYAARVAATLSTPLSEVMAMELSSFALFWREAQAIHDETWGAARAR